MESRKHINLAKNLRHRQTDVERILWIELRNRQFSGYKFRRQHPIGDYIVDFVCLNRRLIIELDGGQHNTESVIDNDSYRQEWLEHQGYKVLRFWDNEVIDNIEGVTGRILEHLESPSLVSSPPCTGIAAVKKLT